jgi:hypothetical protein
VTLPVAPSSPRSVRAWRGAGLLLTLFVVGCNLSEYEHKMQETQAEVERFDEENKLLDDFLKMPTEKVVDKDKSTSKDKEREKYTRTQERIQIFVRPPKGIRATCKDNERPIDSLVYQFERGSNEPAKQPVNPKALPNTPDPTRIPGPAQPKAESNGVLDVFLAFSHLDLKDTIDKQQSDQQTFETRVMANGFKHLDNPVAKPQELRPLKGEPLVFKTFEFTDVAGNFCSVNFHRPKTDPTLLLAIGYRVEKGKEGSAARAIQLSLETLVMDANRKARTAYEKRSRLSPTPVVPGPGTPGPVVPGPQPKQ